MAPIGEYVVCNYIFDQQTDCTVIIKNIYIYIYIICVYKIYLCMYIYIAIICLTSSTTRGELEDRLFI